jgi:CheY-like chemotaxis protein
MDKPIILVVEDNPTSQKVVSLLADEFGFKAIVVGCCAEALQAIREQDVYDVVLMDLRLPDIDGISCTQKLRQYIRDARHIPVIGMTGYVGPNDRQICLDAGLDDHLGKPFTAKEFRDMVLKWAKPQNRPSEKLGQVLDFRQCPKSVSEEQ